MRKINTKAEVITMEVEGLQVRGWRKVCPCCGKTYETTARSQKFCSNECCKKYTSRKRRQKKEYDQVKEIARLSARAHTIGVEVMRQLEALHLVEHQCFGCGCTENLQVHHHNLHWLDNSPSNLVYYCPACHSKEHACIESQLKEESKDKSSVYDTLEWEIYKQLIK